MHLSNAAVLLLGALQPASGTRTFEVLGDLNEIESQYVSTNKTIINYYAPDHGCGGYRAWVGVWPADVCDNYYGEFRTWAYVESTKGSKFNTVRLGNDEMGAGKFKAAFVCEDGQRRPWLVSQPFTVDKAPEAAPGDGSVGKPTEGLNLTFDRAKITQAIRQRRGITQDETAPPGNDVEDGKAKQDKKEEARASAPVRRTVSLMPVPPSSPPSSTTAGGGGGGSLVQVIRAKARGQD
ncbi:hypothetical protein ARSEF4850_005338 [Beauveria asiatica]